MTVEARCDGVKNYDVALMKALLAGVSIWGQKASALHEAVIVDYHQMTAGLQKARANVNSRPTPELGRPAATALGVKSDGRNGNGTSAVEPGDERRTATPEMCCPDPEKQMQRLPEVRTKTHVYYERFSGW